MYFFHFRSEFSSNMVLGPPHTFCVMLYTLSASDNEFRAQDKRTVFLSPAMTGMLSTSTTVDFPFEEEGRA